MHHGDRRLKTAALFTLWFGLSGLAADGPVLAQVPVAAHPWDHDPYRQTLSPAFYRTDTHAFDEKTANRLYNLSVDYPNLVVESSSYDLKVENYMEPGDMTPPQIELRFFYGFVHNEAADQATLKHFNRHNVGNNPGNYVSYSVIARELRQTLFRINFGPGLASKLEALGGGRKLYIAAYVIDGMKTKHHLDAVTVITSSEIPSVISHPLHSGKR